jgi:branched-chain amino acid transport system ATP-binding protein
MASMNILTTQNVSKNYAGLQAVNNVSFELPEGQIRALIGPNGAGKTTFVGMLSGRIPCSSGSVYFNDIDVTHMPAHERMSMGMAYTFQITSVFAKLSVHENVALAARRITELNSKQVNDRVMEVLSRVNLQDRINQIAGDLSYGHQRLLEIAMGLAQSPKLFILDEPTQGLAESEIDDFIVLIKTLSAESTILLIEHNMDVVMKTADYITVLNFGETLAEGTPSEIRSNEAVQSAYLGS